MEQKMLQVAQIDGNDLLNEFAQLKAEISEIKAHIKGNNPLEVLERADVVQIFGIAPSTLWLWTKKGVITAKKMGNRVFYTRADVEKALITVKPAINGK